MSRDVDVVIVGAGISGIGAAYHLQTKRPRASFVLLEARESLGGTWDLFRYPGVRSDSDMYTLGFAFRPWTGDKTIADGPSILAYLRETAAAYGIDRKIRYRQRVERARWSSRERRWTLDVRDGASGDVVRYTCKFLFGCAGYYDYAEGYTPELRGRERFAGRVVHPQHWTDDVEVAGKRVVVIGSGATAVTLVPALAETAAHVTMLQRSPTYIASLPATDEIAILLRRWLPGGTAYALTRWKNILLASGFYAYCRRFPERARRLLVGRVGAALDGAADVAEHFTPRYAPWDERVCIVPDGDLFRAIRAGRASVVTDTIETFTERGIRLRSGDELDADLVVTATGLRVRLLGGVALEVDGRAVKSSESVVYMGIMLSDVPNFAMTIGYTNASWTLKADLTGEFVCRLLDHMDRHGYASCTPRRDDRATDEVPLLDLSSGYVRRALDDLPRQGGELPWRLHQNYVRDLVLLRRARLDDRALEFA